MLLSMQKSVVINLLKKRRLDYGSTDNRNPLFDSNNS